MQDDAIESLVLDDTMESSVLDDTVESQVLDDTSEVLSDTAELSVCSAV